MQNDMLIERGWKSYRSMVVPKNASKRQGVETRQAFYGGAAVLMASIMLCIDPGEDPTDTDLTRMANIQAELDAFGQELDKQLFGGTEH